MNSHPALKKANQNPLFNSVEGSGSFSHLGLLVEHIIGTTLSFV